MNEVQEKILRLKDKTFYDLNPPYQSGPYLFNQIYVAGEFRIEGYYCVKGIPVGSTEFKCFLFPLTENTAVKKSTRQKFTRQKRHLTLVASK